MTQTEHWHCPKRSNSVNLVLCVNNKPGPGFRMEYCYSENIQKLALRASPLFSVNLEFSQNEFRQWAVESLWNILIQPNLQIWIQYMCTCNPFSFYYDHVTWTVNHFYLWFDTLCFTLIWPSWLTGCLVLRISHLQLVPDVWNNIAFCFTVGPSLEVL